MTTVALPRLTEETAVYGRQPRELGRADMLTVTWRNLKALMRTQEQVFFAAVQPIMFTLLFVYVFGGAIHTSVPYVDFLIPGIYVQTVAFGAVATAVGLSEDLSKGLIERFRALPMARSAVLGGRTTADLVRNIFVVLLIPAVGFAVGFRISTNFGLFLSAPLDRVALQLHALLGLRDRGALGAQCGDGADDGVSDLVPFHLCVVRLRAGECDAGLAPGLRQPSTGDPGRRPDAR